jgi:hypothetical protein
MGRAPEGFLTLAISLVVRASGPADNDVPLRPGRLSFFVRGIGIAATLVVVLLRAMFFGGLPGVSLSVVVRSFTVLLAALVIHTRRSMGHAKALCDPTVSFRKPQLWRRSMRCASLESQRNTPPTRTQRAPLHDCTDCSRKGFRVE